VTTAEEQPTKEQIYKFVKGCEDIDGGCGHCIAKALRAFVFAFPYSADEVNKGWVEQLGYESKGWVREW
jgi:hypothetical protein